MENSDHHCEVDCDQWEGIHDVGAIDVDGSLHCTLCDENTPCKGVSQVLYEEDYLNCFCIVPYEAGTPRERID